jgi:hypothetical protein
MKNGGTTALRLIVVSRKATLGSSFVATQGWRPQSRWD